jgi:predicted  nucleic acid-binding Zn-ribbon protein
VHPDVAALLAVQAEDDIVDGIVAQLDAIAPRLVALDAARATTVRTIEELRLQIDQDEKKRAELAERLSDHKQRQERNVAQLDVVKRMREATAAVSQVEMGRKILLELENNVRELVTRLADARKALETRQSELERLDAEQQGTRDAINAEQTALQASLAGARAARDAKAEKVSALNRKMYERIRARRRSTSLFALESGACGSCDTSIPVQRRNAMSSSGAIDVCEACGVLIYAKE